MKMILLKRLAGFALAVLFLQNNLVAQDFHFSHLEEGLSQKNVLAIHQDKFGFMWFGTKNGLNQYNGYSFTIFENSPDNPNSLKNNWITSIAEDSKGNLFLGTYGGGLNIYNRATGKFSAILPVENNPEGLPSAIVVSLEFLNEKELLVGTSEGLALIDIANRKPKRIQLEGQAPNLYISAIEKDKDGFIWLATNNGVIRTDLKGTEVLNYNLNSEGVKLNDSFLRSLLIDIEGNIWLGENMGGVSLLKPKGDSYELTVFPVLANSPKGTNSATILSMMQDRQGRIWLGTENGGLSLYNSNENTFTHFLPDPEDPSSISNNSVWSMAEDRAGNLWFGTYNKGLSKIDPYLLKFKKVTRTDNQETGLNNSVINTFFQDDIGRLWVGTDGGGINLYYTLTNEFHHFTAKGNPVDVSSNAILCMEKGGGGNLWIGTWGGGVSICENYNSGNPVFRKIYAPFNVFSIAPASNGKTWMGTWGEGLFLTDKNESNDKVFAAGKAEEGMLTNPFIFHVYEDSKSRIWVSTLVGLNLIEKEENGWKVTHFLNDFEDPTSLSSNTVLFAFEDSKNQIWIGTESGLNLFKEDSRNFKQVRKNDGLPGNGIKSMLEDPEGNLWIATNSGLSKYNPEAETFRNYDRGDGLQGDDFNARSALLSKGGEFFFGGTGGYNYFRPEFVVDNPNVPSVYLTDFKLFNKSVGVGTKGSPLKKEILLTDHITLTHQQSIFSFEFVGLNYTHTEKNKYAYRMQGLEEDWNYVGNQRFASYSNLDAGDYVFEVKASNNDGLWSKNNVEMGITVLPPWYETWWARTLFLSFIVGASVAFYKIRVSILKKQKQELERQVEERTKDLKSANENLAAKNDEINSQNEELHLQAEEIAAQRDKLEHQHKELENAYQDISKVSEVGKSVTGNLSLDAIFQQMYNDVNAMLDAPHFAIGSFDQSHQALNFMEISGQNQKPTHNWYVITDDSKPSVYCYNKGQELIFSDFNDEVEKIIPGMTGGGRSEFRSAMYFPLVSKEKKVGVVVAKSHQRNAYKIRQQTIFQSLASFVATAIDNTQAYQLIHEKNVQITDSIRYAKTIQQAILPRKEELKAAFADHFVLFRPKDIVSGDFYWMHHFPQEQTVFIASVDCTGHGVPGAFMSMIGARLLNEIVVENRIWNPAEILETLHEGVVRSLGQDVETEDGIANSDGMDLCFCKVEYKANGAEVTFTGAKTALYHSDIKTGKLKKIQGDRKSIGGIQSKDKRFTNQKIQLPVASMLYLTTDGIIDQNNPDRKKFGSVRFEAMLEENFNLPLDKQKNILEKALDGFMRKVEQRDDITVLGIKL